MLRAVMLVALVAVACKSGGTYVTNNRGGGGDDRGETNGRSLDFVSNRPEGDDWEIRVRGTTLWASYGDQDKIESLPPVTLDNMQFQKVWKLIDALDLPNHEKGKKDEDDGFVTLVLREPGGEDDKADIYTVYMSRTGEDEDLEELAIYLQALIKKFHKVDAEF